jgi:hypothetical protein
VFYGVIAAVVVGGGEVYCVAGGVGDGVVVDVGV